MKKKKSTLTSNNVKQINFFFSIALPSQSIPNSHNKSHGVIIMKKIKIKECKISFITFTQITHLKKKNFILGIFKKRKRKKELLF